MPDDSTRSAILRGHYCPRAIFRVIIFCVAVFVCRMQDVCALGKSVKKSHSATREYAGERAIAHTLSHTLFDEGLWTFDNPPFKLLLERYGFTPSTEWLDKLRLASVRFSTGGSGAFVSAHGLVITNHHVIMEQLQKLSSAQRNIVANGYVARALTEELKCPDIELNVLIGMENITGRILFSVKNGMSDDEAFRAEQQEIAAAEREASKGGVRAEVVNLYAGGEYWLYRYKRYTDVRVVMVPELQAANFGGDYDNYTYPRYALDCAFVRVYENGKPLQSSHFLAWKTKGPSEQEMVFVSGHPGSTNRLNTYSQFIFNRDVYYPFMIRRSSGLIETIRRYASKGAEEERQSLDDLLNLENTRKSLVGEYEGLLDKKNDATCKHNEEDLRTKIAAEPELQRRYGSAWETVDRVVQKQSVIFKEYASAFSTPLADIAFNIIRYVNEAERRAIGGKIAPKRKGNAPLESDNDLAELRREILSPTPIYLAYEEAKLAGELDFILSELSAGDPFVKIMLSDGSSILRQPQTVAKDIVRSTRLADTTFRRALIDGGRKAVERSNDPMIVFMRKLVPIWQEREEYQRNNIQVPLASAAEKIAMARFSVYGKNTYPDATFTLRLSVGTVKNYQMNGTLAPAFTTLYGMYDRAAGFQNSDVAKDYRLPTRFVERRDKLNLATPVAFVTNCDIVGGNSGSPLVNKNLEFVGLVFDGNIESLASRFVYNDHTGRSICVHPAFIIESLRKLYDAEALAEELEHMAKPANTRETRGEIRPETPRTGGTRSDSRSITPIEKRR